MKNEKVIWKVKSILEQSENWNKKVFKPFGTLWKMKQFYLIFNLN